MPNIYKVQFDGKRLVAIENLKVWRLLLITIYFRSLRTSLHWVRAPPTKKGYVGPVQRRRKYETLSAMLMDMRCVELWDMRR